KSRLKTSPRLSVVFLMSNSSKLYFNYGHFYSMPSTDNMFTLEYNAPCGITRIGNPSADIPRTIAYAFGYEHALFNRLLLQINGYYRDISNQTDWILYQNYDGMVRYSTYENNRFGDIRGFEIQLSKRIGSWITGWLHYNYMIESSGFFGRRNFYQDPRSQRLYGPEILEEDKFKPQPFLRGNVRLFTPEDWGPSIAGIKPLSGISLDFLYTWKAGRYQSWDPLNVGLFNNLHWKGEHYIDLRVSKRTRIIGSVIAEVFVDINNLFNAKYINELGFVNNYDRYDYYYSLHLPMYKDQEYEYYGFIGGDDQPGDLRSDEKPYIDMPNNTSLTFLNPRYFTFGMRMDF
ncbi:TonB-dependent receptor, partial [bacterium]|nr:TonB-dependent receptor [bacterium]